MNVSDSKRERLLADIELTRQHLSRAINDSRRGIALLFRGGSAVRRRSLRMTGRCPAHIWLALLSTGVAFIWLYRSLRRASLGAHRRYCARYEGTRH